MENHFKTPAKSDIHIRAPQVDSSQLWYSFPCCLLQIPISKLHEIFSSPSYFSTEIAQLIEVVKQKIFSNLYRNIIPRTGLTSKEDFIYPLLKCFISSVFTVSQSPQF